MKVRANAKGFGLTNPEGLQQRRLANDANSHQHERHQQELQ